MKALLRLGVSALPVLLAAVGCGTEPAQDSTASPATESAISPASDGAGPSSGKAALAPAGDLQLPDFACKSAAGQFWPVEVRYNSADKVLFVKVSQPTSGVYYRLPYPGYLAVDSVAAIATGFVLSASRPPSPGDKVVIKADAIPSAYGPYTVLAHLDLKINVYQRFIKDVDISDCSGLPPVTVK